MPWEISLPLNDPIPLLFLLKVITEEAYMTEFYPCQSKLLKSDDWSP